MTQFLAGLPRERFFCPSGTQHGAAANRGVFGFVTISISSRIMPIEVKRQAATPAATRHAVKA